MNFKNKSLFLIAAIQVLFFAGWYYLENSKLSDPTSKTIFVKTLPVDPRDYLSGNYLTLRYEFGSPWNFKSQNKIIREILGGEIYVVLKKDGLWYVPDYISDRKPSVRSDQAVIKGKYVKQSGQIEYGIEKYFINENTKEPERTDKIEVWLVIGDDLTPRIKSLVVNGQEFK